MSSSYSRDGVNFVESMADDTVEINRPGRSVVGTFTALFPLAGAFRAALRLGDSAADRFAELAQCIDHAMADGYAAYLNLDDAEQCQALLDVFMEQADQLWIPSEVCVAAVATLDQVSSGADAGPERAAADLRDLLVTLSQPRGELTDPARDCLHDLGAEWGVQHVRNRGLVGVLADLALRAKQRACPRVRVPKAVLMSYAAAQVENALIETAECFPEEALLQFLASTGLLLGEEEPLATLRRRRPPGSWVRFYQDKVRPPDVMRPASQVEAALAGLRAELEQIRRYVIETRNALRTLTRQAEGAEHDQASDGRGKAPADPAERVYQMCAPAVFELPKLKPFRPPETFNDVTVVRIDPAGGPDGFLQVVISWDGGGASRQLPMAFFSELVENATESARDARSRALAEECLR